LLSSRRDRINQASASPESQERASRNSRALPAPEVTIAKRSWQQLRQRLVAEGKAQWLDELKPFVGGAGATPPNQEEVAARLGVPIATLRTSLSRLRQRYRDLLRTEVANTVSDPADMDEELRYLYRVLN